MNSLKYIHHQKPLEQIDIGPLSDQIADRIVDAIALGQIKSGDRLNEAELADNLGVSRVPIREATRILSSQGIIIPSPRRGVRVGIFDEAWATQLHNSRVAIERLAARIVSDKFAEDPSRVLQVTAAAEKIRETTSHYPLNAYEVNRADIAFHSAIFRIADSPLLSTLWAAIARHVLIMFASETYRATDLEWVNSQHDRYIETLLNGSAEQLDNEVEGHVAAVRIFVMEEKEKKIQ